MQRRAVRVFVTPDDAAVAVRLGGLLALTGAAICATLALGVSRWAPEDLVPLLVMLAVVTATGVVAVRAPLRMPPGAVAATVLFGTAAISTGMVVVGTEAVAAADNEMLYLLPVLYSAYFCLRWVTILVTLTASVGYAVALRVASAEMPAASWLTTTSALVVVAGLITVMRQRDVRQMSTARAEAGRDPLTGLLNRRGLAARVAGLAPVGRVSLLVVDVDHFKAVNDRLGHAAGDEVLERLAGALTQRSRTGDLVVRLGGEEFALLLPGCDAEEAQTRAEGLRLAVEQASASWLAPVTLSVGTATRLASGVDLPALLADADRALYAAKAAGRNTVRAS